MSFLNCFHIGNLVDFTLIEEAVEDAMILYGMTKI